MAPQFRSVNCSPHPGDSVSPLSMFSYSRISSHLSLPFSPRPHQPSASFPPNSAPPFARFLSAVRQRARSASGSQVGVVPGDDTTGRQSSTPPLCVLWTDIQLEDAVLLHRDQPRVREHLYVVVRCSPRKTRPRIPPSTIDWADARGRNLDKSGAA
jgi:hypothetical protein